MRTIRLPWLDHQWCSLCHHRLRNNIHGTGQTRSATSLHNGRNLDRLRKWTLCLCRNQTRVQGTEKILSKKLKWKPKQHLPESCLSIPNALTVDYVTFESGTHFNTSLTPMVKLTSTTSNKTRPRYMSNGIQSWHSRTSFIVPEPSRSMPPMDADLSLSKKLWIKCTH